MTVPNRDPDFKYGHYDIWFDEMIAYSNLAEGTMKVLKFKINPRGKIYDANPSSGHISEVMPLEVQEAYQAHIHKVFEEVMLGNN